MLAPGLGPAARENARKSAHVSRCCGVIAAQETQGLALKKTTRATLYESPVSMLLLKLALRVYFFAAA
jgi:hypothetical protein